jgi:NAD(P)-dependent dehydrogenase (short-subunit alcohol dehydrogenase family)
MAHKKPSSRCLHNAYDFTPEISIADLSDKVIIVTGGNAGVGKATITAIAQHNPKRLYATARSREKFDAALANIKETVPEAKVDFLEMDLASLPSVKAAADKVLLENDRLDVVINNAGIMAVPHAVTKDGYEIHFGTNHLGHALFIRKLLPLMQKTASLPNSDVRIVNVTSAGHFMAPSKGILFDQLKSDMKGFHEYTLYGQSKLANVFHAKALAKKYPDIKCTSVHPGRVDTGLLDHYSGPFMTFQKVFDWIVKPLSPYQGSLNQLWAAFGSKNNVKSGSYYTPVGNETRMVDKRSRNESLAEELWNWQDTEFERLGLI